VEYQLNGQTYTKTITNKVKGQFGMNTYASFTLPAISEAGTYDFLMRVVKVNGQDNMDQTPEAVTPVQVLNTVPRKRTLMEEYTGTWCGWCTRGFVALELLKKNYPDDFVTISYHNSDPMEIMTSAYYPSQVSGYPDAWIDRGMNVDPYGGEGDLSRFSTLDVLQWRNAMFANAAIDLKAELNEAEDEVNVTANVTFPYSDDKANYALEYVLVEDGMTGPAGTDWDQQNYYSGETSVSADLKEMASKGSTISGLVFNDVAVGISEIGGISESIPQSVKADVPVEHTHTFYPDYCYNTSYDPVIQDKHQLYVVAMLIDLNENIVANAIKVKVTTPEAVGIESVNTSKPAGENRFYNLQGQRLNKAQKGVNIVNGRKIVRR
jgi:thiol-disulfide isomerase/thioredoxin